MFAWTMLIFAMIWTWSNDPEPVGSVDIGRGVSLPAYMTGPVSHAWWATVILMLVAGSLYLSFVFSYLYIWTVAPQFWPGYDVPLSSTSRTLFSALLLATAAGAMFAAGRILARSRLAFTLLLAASAAALGGALSAEIAGHW